MEAMDRERQSFDGTMDLFRDVPTGGNPPRHTEPEQRETVTSAPSIGTSQSQRDYFEEFFRQKDE